MPLTLTQNGETIKVQRCPAPVRYEGVSLMINGLPQEGKVTKWKDRTYTYFSVGGNDFYVEGPLTADPISFILPDGFQATKAKNRLEAYEGLKAKRDAAKAEAAANGEAPATKPRGRKKAAKGDTEAQAQAAAQWGGDAQAAA